MKSVIRKGIEYIFNTNKIYKANLFRGNEKCIQGELFSYLSNSIPNYENLFLEFPYGKSNHVDIAEFDFSIPRIKTGIELKHAIGNKPWEHTFERFQQDVYKRSSREIYLEIPNFYFVFFTTLITGVEPKHCYKVLEKYPLLEKYISKGVIYDNVFSERVEPALNKVKSKIDMNSQHLTFEKKGVFGEVNMRFDFLICEPDLSLFSP